ncbi:MAG: response regulator receiver protein [Thermoleophilia bacterium]|nr:response regulator receiver protein [Thermoleophilia bacterium]
MTCRLVLCDDARDFVRLLKLLIDMESDMEVVGVAHDGAEAISVCTELQPDLLVLDVSMPVMDGLTALPRIREVSPGTSVVMLSGFSSAAMKRQALELGASQFIEKGIPPSELTGQLRAQCT